MFASAGVSPAHMATFTNWQASAAAPFFTEPANVRSTSRLISMCGRSHASAVRCARPRTYLRLMQTVRRPIQRRRQYDGAVYDPIRQVGRCRRTPATHIPTAIT